MSCHDRYSVSEITPPRPSESCRACEGMGFYPTPIKDEWPPGAKPDSVGCVFVKCKDCNGTRRRDKAGKAITDGEIGEATAKIRGAIRGTKGQP